MFDLNAAGLQSGVQAWSFHQDSSHANAARTGRSSLMFLCLRSDGFGKFSTSLGKKGDGCAACDVSLCHHHQSETSKLRFLILHEPQRRAK